MILLATLILWAANYSSRNSVCEYYLIKPLSQGELTAYELVNLLEWMAPSWDAAREAARHLVLTRKLGTAKLFVCNQFNLSY